jgi:hypothetical protein
MSATPHLEKLHALLNNEKLPAANKPAITDAIKRYQSWIARLDEVLTVGGEPDSILATMVHLLNEYRQFLDVDLIYDNPEDFLYRQKGQLKLDNSVIEEFLPRLMNPILVPELSGIDVAVGPMQTFSATYFTTSLEELAADAGLKIRTKNQDFAISKRLYLQASHTADFEPASYQETNLAFVVAECKTNLDKTMFQEATATAHDVKMAMPGAKYYLICEWLDMTPLSTAPTDIDEVIVLRKARRLRATIRGKFSSYKGRCAMRETYVNYLTKNALQTSMFKRFVTHIRGLLRQDRPKEQDVLELGYF